MEKIRKLQGKVRSIIERISRYITSGDIPFLRESFEYASIKSQLMDICANVREARF
jgi:hypothetical protein